MATKYKIVSSHWDTQPFEYTRVYVCVCLCVMTSLTISITVHEGTTNVITECVHEGTTNVTTERVHEGTTNVTTERVCTHVQYLHRTKSLALALALPPMLDTVKL